MYLWFVVCVCLIAMCVASFDLDFVVCDLLMWFVGLLVLRVDSWFACVS